MVISKTVFKREIVEKECTLIKADDGEVNDWGKTAEGKNMIVGRKEGIVLTWQDPEGLEELDELTKSAKSNSGIYKILGNAYGKEGKKWLMSATKNEYIEEQHIPYYFGLLEYLVGYKFSLTMEVGKFTRIKERDIVTPVKFPTLKEVEAKSAKLATNQDGFNGYKDAKEDDGAEIGGFKVAADGDDTSFNI